MKVGHYSDQPEPYMGPVVAREAADLVLQRQEELLALGAQTLLRSEIKNDNRTLLTPGIVETTAIEAEPDEEVLGPLVTIRFVSTVDEAIARANATKFGLAAGIFCSEREIYEKVRTAVKAGIINWNQALTGSSAWAPFGGIKASGNYRTSGFLSTDYCVRSIASIEVRNPQHSETLPPGLHLD